MILNNLSWLYLKADKQNQDLNRALKLSEKALYLSKWENAKVVHTYIILLIALNELDKAKQALERGLNIFKQDKELLELKDELLTS